MKVVYCDCNEGVLQKEDTVGHYVMPSFEQNLTLWHVVAYRN